MSVGRGAAIAIAAIVVLALIVWRIREHQSNERAEAASDNTRDDDEGSIGY